MHTYRDGGRAFEPYYELLKPRIHHLHVKDCTKDLKLVLCGEGDVPLREIASVLRDDGFRWYVSFKWEKVWHPDLQEPEIAFPHFASFYHTLGV